MTFFGAPVPVPPGTPEFAPELTPAVRPAAVPVPGPAAVPVPVPGPGDVPIPLPVPVRAAPPPVPATSPAVGEVPFPNPAPAPLGLGPDPLPEPSIPEPRELFPFPPDCSSATRFPGGMTNRSAATGGFALAENILTGSPTGEVGVASLDACGGASVSRTGCIVSLGHAARARAWRRRMASGVADGCGRLSH